MRRRSIIARDSPPRHASAASASAASSCARSWTTRAFSWRSSAARRATVPASALIWLLTVVITRSFSVLAASSPEATPHCSLTSRRIGPTRRRSGRALLVRRALGERRLQLADLYARSVSFSSASRARSGSSSSPWPASQEGVPSVGVEEEACTHAIGELRSSHVFHGAVMPKNFRLRRWDLMIGNSQLTRTIATWRGPVMLVLAVTGASFTPSSLVPGRGSRRTGPSRRAQATSLVRARSPPSPTRFGAAPKRGFRERAIPATANAPPTRAGVACLDSGAAKMCVKSTHCPLRIHVTYTTPALARAGGGAVASASAAATITSYAPAAAGAASVTS